MQKVLTKSNLNETLPRLRSCRYEKQRPKKCRFLLGHCYTKKILTTNNLCKRNQPRDPICKLCKVSLETPLHLCKDCPLIVEAWSIIQNWLNLSQLQNIPRNGSIYKHSSKCRAHLDKSHRTSLHPLMVCLVDYLETTQLKNLPTMQPRQIDGLIKDDTQQFN